MWQSGFCKLLCVGSGTSHDLRRERSYSFVGKSDMDEQEVAELIEEATTDMEADDILAKAPHWGVGVHHAGVTKKYRQMVERMFRAKRIRVVLATSECFSASLAPLHPYACSAEAVSCEVMLTPNNILQRVCQFYVHG